VSTPSPTSGAPFQSSLFDEDGIASIESDDDPGERFVVCRNPAQADRSKAKRSLLIDKTLEALSEVTSA
jgi:hypothetical protein